MVQSNRVRRWWPALAGGAALGAAAILGFGGNVSSLIAEDAKPTQKKPADAKNPPSYKADDVHIGAPPELEALRKAVEKAGKHGENVDDIRKHLDALEKAMTGRAWVKPTPPVEIVRPGQPPRFALPAAPGFRQMPVVPGFRQMPAFPQFGGGLNADAMRKAQEMMQKAQQNLLAHPQDADAMRQMMEQQQKFLHEAMGGLGVRIAGVPGLGVNGRINRIGDGRLGVRLERVAPAVATQLGLPAGNGLLVAEVVPGSAAEKAGVKENDILLDFAGAAVTDDSLDLARRVHDAKTGEKVDMTVMRKGKKESLKLEMPELNRIREGRGADAEPAVGVAAANSMSMTVNNGHFQLSARSDGVSYSVTGEMVDGKPSASGITIAEGDKSTKYDSIDKVPAEHRAKIEGMMGKFHRKID